jgi:glycine C-acetyltransferase
MVDTISSLPEVELSRDGAAHMQRPTLESSQSGVVTMDGQSVIMLGSNNYLGLASHPKVIERAKATLDSLGCGPAINPGLCTTPVHVELAEAIADFTQSEAAILFNSCTAANVALVQTLMGPNDVTLSDQYNHASIVDACRISKTTTKIYPHRDLLALDDLLQENQSARLRMIISDGVFSMDGDTIPLVDVIKLAEKRSAIVAVDDSHGAGVIGPSGRGTAEHHGVMGQVDIHTGTFSKALGAAGGGYVAGSKALIDFLNDRARFFIFTSAMSPSAAASALAALQVLDEGPGLLESLRDNTNRFRQGVEQMGLKVLGGESPITPILISDTSVATELSARLFQQGVYIPAFGYPIVPEGEARLRAQPSAAHSSADIDRTLIAIEDCAKQVGLI